MSRMGNASSFFQREDAQGLQVLGPLFLLCTLSFATKSQIAFDFLFLSLVGFYLSARFQLRGFVYALVLLGIGSAAKHFMVNDHLWQLGLQGSLATAFLITALSSEQSSFLTQSYIAQLETNAATLRNLEEEFSKNNEISLSLQIAAQERLAQLQKEFDELQSEHSSILILNEVLRRSNAKAMQESHSLQGSFLDQQRKVDLLRNELKQSQAELALLKNTEEVLRQNQELFEELNVAREELEQAQIFKESIAWKHEKEQNRALTAENELIEAKEQMEGFRLEIKTLQSLLQQMAPEVDQARKLNAEYNEVASQRNFLAEKLREYESEITNLKNRPLDPEMLQELHSSRAKIDALVSEKNALEEQYILASRKIADLQRRLADTVPAIGSKERKTISNRV
jgi:chromosome segregation ATPase